jgi:tight adherence protein C
MLLNLITVAAFLLLLCLVFLVGRLTVGRRDPVLERLSVGGEGLATDDRLALGQLTEGMATQVPQTQESVLALEAELRRAGNYRPRAVQEYLATRNLAIVLVVLITGGLIVMAGPEYPRVCLGLGVAGLIAALLVFSVPRLILRARGNARIQRIERGLPDALDMITMCIAGGLPFREALTHVTSEIYSAHPDLATELDYVRRQGQLGTMKQAFQQFAARVDSEEVRALAGLVTDAERLGTNVEGAIRHHADSIRQMYRQRADERANKTGVKITLPFIFCLIPAMLTLLVAPALLNLRQTLNTAREQQAGTPGSIFGPRPSELIQQRQAVPRPGRAAPPAPAPEPQAPEPVRVLSP